MDVDVDSLIACITNAEGDPHELSTMPVLTG